MRVYEGQQCPVCGQGVVRRAHSEKYGAFLGCGTSDYGRGDRSAWHLDGTRLNSGTVSNSPNSRGVSVAAIVVGAILLLIVLQMLF
jgi:hypothetical protein